MKFKVRWEHIISLIDKETATNLYLYLITSKINGKFKLSNFINRIFLAEYLQLWNVDHRGEFMRGFNSHSEKIDFPTYIFFTLAIR